MSAAERPFASIADETNLEGKRVLVRASLNVPLSEDGSLVDDFRLKKALQTIQFLLEQNAKLIVMGHIGRDPTESLAPVFEYFQRHLPITFSQNVVGDDVTEAVEHMQDGNAMLLENTRMHPGEAANDPAFARALASLADIYVNDAFSVSHRDHASITGVTKLLPSFGGILFTQEYDALCEVRTPQRPALFILGGAKFETKEPLVRTFLDIYDQVFIGGALANDFFKEKGYEVGVSLLSEDPIEVASIITHEHLLLPLDVTVLTRENTHEEKELNEILPGDKINDCGPKTIEMLAKVVESSNFIVWNGPVGDYQTGFGKYTKEVADLVATSNAKTVIGGGDTVSFLDQQHMLDHFSFTSTAGGAMLAFLLDPNIPGIAALQENRVRGAT